MNIENINKDSVIGLIKKYDKEYKISLMILTAPLSLNPEPIDENYHKILDFTKVPIYLISKVRINLTQFVNL